MFPKQIIICRHGEKPKDKNYFGLSQKGFARSAYLVDYFANPITVKGKPMYNKPDKIYCFNVHNGINRSKQLMQPLIDSHNIPHSYIYNNHEDGTTEMINELFADNGNANVLICWEHKIIPQMIQLIAQHIGADFSKFKYWSSEPDKIKTDSAEYALTIVIDPTNKTLIVVDQSNDFSKDDQKLRKLDHHKIIYKL